jgi:hypothetical protein
MTVHSLMPVGAPVKEPLSHGLASVADVRPEPMSGGQVNPHWRQGVFWEDVCPDGGTTYDACISALSLGVSGLPAPDVKAATADRTFWGATPFTVMVEIDCSPPGFWDNVDATVAKTFTEAEAFEVESVFYTGVVSGQTIAYPHLLSTTARSDDDGIVFQLITGNVGPTGAIDPVEALGKLEAALSSCVRGIGTIFMPTELLAHLVAQHVIEENGGRYYSPAGHKISVSAAYTGAAPNGTSTPGVLWMYGTGPVFMYRSAGKFVGNRTQSLARDVDTLKRIFERTYVIGYDCCLFGVAVNTGGAITGTPGAAT